MVFDFYEMLESTGFVIVIKARRRQRELTNDGLHEIMLTGAANDLWRRQPKYRIPTAVAG